VRALDLAAILFERGDELVLHRVEGEITNEKSLTHYCYLLWTLALGLTDVARRSIYGSGLLVPKIDSRRRRSYLRGITCLPGSQARSQAGPPGQGARKLAGGGRASLEPCSEFLSRSSGRFREIW